MKVYIVIKDSDKPNPYYLPNEEYVLIDCVRANRDSALERISELAKEGYRNTDYKEFILR